MIARTLTALLLLIATPAWAELVRIEVKSRADVLAGQAFGAAGPYEKLVRDRSTSRSIRGTPANRIITDLDKAPRTPAAGRVLVRLLPDQAEGSRARQRHAALRGVEPRRQGHARVLQLRRGQPRSDRAPREFGDGFLLEQGFTLMWVGWQFDPPLREGLVRVFAPIAREADGRAIQGLVRSDFVVTETVEAGLAGRSRSPGLRGRRPPTTRRPSSPCATRWRAPRRTIPRAEWQFSEDGKSVRMAAGLPAEEDLRGRLHRARIRRWSASVPPPCATPSRGSSTASASELGLAAGAIKRAIALRHLAERPVPAHVSVLRLQRRRGAPQGVRRRHAARGRRRPRQLQPPLRAALARRASVHQLLLSHRHLPVHRRAAARPRDRRHRRPAAHATKPEHRPKVFYTNSSYEYWGRAASLIHTSVDGTPRRARRRRTRASTSWPPASTAWPPSRLRARSASSRTTRSTTAG